MNARDRILQRLRRAGTTAAEPTSPAPATVPAHALPPKGDGLLDAFGKHARKSGSRVLVVTTTAELESAFQSLAETLALPAKSLADRLAQLPEGNGHYLVVRARAAIAETGTLCLDSRQLASGDLFLCEHLVVLVDESDIAPYPEGAFCRSTPGARAIHWVTGPSRTADVEQTLQIGAHGPRTVTCVVRRA